MFNLIRPNEILKKILTKNNTIYGNNYNKLSNNDKVVLHNYLTSKQSEKYFEVNIFNINILYYFFINKNNFTTNSDISDGVCANHMCSKITKFNGMKKGFNKYCSLKCSNTDEEVKQKKVSSSLVKFGVSNPMQKTEIKNKAKKSKKEKYGSSEAFNEYLSETQKSIHKSISKGEYAKRDKKAKQTKQLKYNDANYNNIDKMRKTQIEKFGDLYIGLYSKQASENSNTLHIKNKDDINEKFITKKYVNGEWSIYDLAKHYGVKYDAALNYIHTFGIKLKYVKSRYEKEFSDLFPLTIQNDRNILDGLEIDFLFEESKFGVEIDGLYWHSTKFKDKDYHLNKTKLAQSKGYQLLHIFENEWLNTTKRKIWLSVINTKLNKNIKIYARKCEIKNISNKDAVIFLENNHMQGKINGTHIGLFYEDKLVSMVTLGKPRFNKNYDYELLRMCSKLNTTVVGGFSRLLKHFEREYKPKNIISYANKRWSNGNVYEVNGFTKEKTSPPSYFTLDGNNLKSRFYTQKHKLPTNGKETAFECMDRLNILRIYDCGNLVYKKDYL